MVTLTLQIYDLRTWRMSDGKISSIPQVGRATVAGSENGRVHTHENEKGICVEPQGVVTRRTGRKFEGY